MKDIHLRCSDQEMEFVEKIRKKYDLQSQSSSLRFIIQQSMLEDENPDQKYKDMFSQNEDNWDRVFGILDQHTEIMKVIISALTEE